MPTHQPTTSEMLAATAPMSRCAGSMTARSPLCSRAVLARGFAFSIYGELCESDKHSLKGRPISLDFSLIQIRIYLFSQRELGTRNFALDSGNGSPSAQRAVTTFDRYSTFTINGVRGCSRTAFGRVQESRSFTKLSLSGGINSIQEVSSFILLKRPVHRMLLSACPASMSITTAVRCRRPRTAQIQSSSAQFRCAKHISGRSANAWSNSMTIFSLEDRWPRGPSQRRPDTRYAHNSDGLRRGRSVRFPSTRRSDDRRAWPG